MGRILYQFHLFFTKFRWFSAAFLLLVILLSALSISRLSFIEDISRILPDSKNVTKLKYVLKESTLMNKVIFDIHLKNDSTAPDQLCAYAEQMSNFLEQDSISKYFRSLQLKVADDKMMDMMDVVKNNLPYFLNDQDYSRIEAKINSDSIKQIVSSGYKSMLSPIGFVSSKYFLEDPFGMQFMALEKVQSFNLSEDVTLYQGRVMNTEKTDLFLFANLSKSNTPADNEYIFKSIEEYQKQLEKVFPDIQQQVFGGALVAQENAQIIKRDVAVTLTITLILLISLVAYFFRTKRAVVVIFIPTILGGLFALGILSVFKDEISIISLGIGAVLLGMSIDFSLHVYAHYREHHSFKSLFSQISIPLFLSMSTTVVAFLALRLVHSEVLSDLGLFASLSIFFSAILAVTLLPVIIKKSKPKNIQNDTFLDKISRYEAHKKGKLMLSVVAITIVLYFVGGNIPFESDMLKSNYISNKTDLAEQRINRVFGKANKDLFIISIAKSRDEVLEQNHELNVVLDSLQEAGLIKRYSSVNKLIKSNKEQAIALEKWNKFWQKQFPLADSTLDAEGQAIGFKHGAFKKFCQIVKANYKEIDSTDWALMSDLILNDFLIESDTMQAAITVLKLDDIRAAKNAIEEKIHSPNIWVYNSQIFVTALIQQLDRNMNSLIYWSLLFVFLILLLYFGRIELALITLIPIVFGYIWTVGIMSIFNIQFNIFNIIVLSFIFGLGIDYGIFVTNGILQKYSQNINVIREYRASILMSFFTTIIGVGALIFAHHPALQSIAIIAIIGISSTLLVTFTLQSWLLNFILYNKGAKRLKPVTFTDFILSVLSLFYFVSGSLFLSLIGLIFSIIPFGTKYKKLLFHRVLQAFSWWMIYANFLSKKKIINPNNEDFSKPSVIIANHQSHVDVMLVLLLNPKLLILTNDKQYNSWLYGKVLKYADFLPITLPHEELIERLQEKVNLGYSIVVFPEGTRNLKPELLRFQRGAFLLARELKLELLPIMFHGIRFILNTNEFFLRRSQMTTKFLPRIDLSKGEYGITLKKQSTHVREYFNKEYIQFCQEIEKPSYYRGRLTMSYLFRSPIIEWYMKIKTKMEDNYTYFDDLIPRDAKVSDLGCGYGFLIYTLAQTAPEREFIGVDFDEDKIVIAQNISLATAKTRFTHADLTKYEIEASDVIVILDTLHYLNFEQRNLVIRNAFSKLNENGFIIIRDGDREMKEKHKVTKLSEVLSTFIKFNKADYSDLDFLSRSEIKDISKEIGANLEIVDNTQFTSNVIYILRK
jgi:1-acyl-sn-glycerol-3-phosphate acyltransferase